MIGSDLIPKIEKLEKRFDELNTLLEDPAVLKQPEQLKVLGREHRELTVVLSKCKVFKKAIEKIKEAQEIIHSSDDPDFKELAKEELEENETLVESLEQEIKLLLIPKDPQDSKSAIMEIRAGTGGDEAGLFAGDLYRMYSKYIERKGWKLEVLSSNPTELGGFKEIVFSSIGFSVFLRRKQVDAFIRRQRRLWFCPKLKR